jgi:hypothetical protein
MISSPDEFCRLLADRAGYLVAADRELVWSSRRYPDPEAGRELAARSYDRGYYPVRATR